MNGIGSTPPLTSRLWISSWLTFSCVDRPGLTRISWPAGPKLTTACGMAYFRGADIVCAATSSEDKWSAWRSCVTVAHWPVNPREERLQVWTHLGERREEPRWARRRWCTDSARSCWTTDRSFWSSPRFLSNKEERLRCSWRNSPRSRRGEAERRLSSARTWKTENKLSTSSFSTQFILFVCQDNENNFQPTRWR